MAVAAVVVVPLLFYGHRQAEALSAWALGALPNWLDWLVVVLWPVAALLAIIVASWLFGLVAAFVASPWLGLLAAQAERIEFGDAVEVNEGIGALIVNAGRRELQKLRYHLPRLAALLLLPLLPVVNLVAPLLWLVFGAWLLALQFVDYAAENRGLPFAATRPCSPSTAPPRSASAPWLRSRWRCRWRHWSSCPQPCAAAPCCGGGCNRHPARLKRPRVPPVEPDSRLRQACVPRPQRKSPCPRSSR